MLLFFTIVLILAILAGVGGYAFHLTTGTRLMAQSKRDAELLLENARREAETKSKEIQLTVQQELLKAREAQQRELEAIRKKIDEHELNLTKREDTLDRKLDTLSVKQSKVDEVERQVAAREKKIAGKDEQLTAVLAEQREKLLAINGMSAEQARETAAPPDGRRVPSRGRRVDQAHHRAGPGRGPRKEPADHHHRHPAVRRRPNRRAHRQHGGHPR